MLPATASGSLRRNGLEQLKMQRLWERPVVAPALSIAMEALWQQLPVTDLRQLFVRGTHSVGPVFPFALPGQCGV